MDKPKLLIVEDDDAIRTQMKWALAQDYTVLLAEDRRSALEVCSREQPAVVTLDLGLPPQPAGVEEGLHTLASILKQDLFTKVIVITGQTDKAHALQAVAQGAYDFLSKPIELEELKVILRRACHVAQLERENRQLRQQGRAESFEGMLGTSPQMQEVFATIRKVAPSDASVLIVGESGTGKELAARAIHSHSTRKDGPFVAINCAAIPENLLESELFGHEKGAFTGAHVQQRGRVELAQNGTLFLDEIGELPLPLQAKLLRFLQGHRIERIGGRKEIAVDVRVITATNTDLQQAVVENRFREDLYYRIAVLVLSMPPLQEREGDIPLLANALLRKYALENKKQRISFTHRALRALETHHWPGNVRELENRIKRAVIMAEGTEVTPAHLDLAAVEPYAGKTLKVAREALEKDMIQQALAKQKGKLARAAADLGISRPTLYDLMEKLGIKRE